MRPRDNCSFHCSQIWHLRLTTIDATSDSITTSGLANDDEMHLHCTALFDDKMFIECSQSDIIVINRPFLNYKIMPK